MFYFLLFIILLIGFICIKNRKSSQSIAFAMLLGVYFLAFFAMLLYLSKDSYYYNVISRYFYLPEFMWRRMFFLNISKFTVIRLLNLSSLGIVLCSVFFSLTVFKGKQDKYKKTITICKRAIIIYAVIVAILYDPWVNIQSYYMLYPDFLTSAQYNFALSILHTCTQSINIAIILCTVIVLVISCINLPRIRMIQIHTYSLSFCYFALCVCYCFLFSFAPAYFMRISKISKTHAFISIRLFNSPTIYSVLPYFLIVFTLLITYSIYKISRINKKIEARDFNISKQISASETTSKVFCHYIKNEVLAIQSQIEMLPENDDNRELLNNSVERCQHLYNRIDAIHRSTKNSELHLHEDNLCTLVHKVTDSFKGELDEYNVNVITPAHPVLALIDSEYFGQSLHNLIRNALDSMEALPPERKNLTIHLQPLDRWIILSVTDTGVGIAGENLVNIFTPFFSSASFSKHWGIGLPLTYKIIKAHEGKIEVESTVDKGTTIRIILPNLNSAASQSKTLEDNRWKHKK